MELKREYPLNKIRNIGLVAHIDAGKTTTTERILFYTGRIYRIGEVDEGTSTMDWMDQERERGITITSAATYCKWNDCQINIIDTPGHVDFTVEVERALRVLDGCIVIFDVMNGVESQSETVWHQADRYNVPRIVFVNKMDRIGGDFHSVIDQIKKRLLSKPLIIQLPYYENDKFSGIIDLIDKKLILWKENAENIKDNMIISEIPEKEINKYTEYRDLLIETLSEYDEQIMDKFVHSKQITSDEIKKVIRRLTVTSKVFPVLCGSSLKNKGIQQLLDAVVDYLPSPVDIPPVKGENPDTGEIQIRNHSESDPMSALVFKIQTDSYVGKLNYIRVYSGKITTGTYIYNPRKSRKERVTRILRMHANTREDVSYALAGDIVGVIGPKWTSTGDTLCDEKHPIIYEPMQFPEPVLWVAVEPKKQQDQEKISYALNRISEEDPTFKVKVDKETGQTVISGMGELHLEIIVERIKREFNVMLNISKPHVAYRETITTKVVEEGKYIRQTGGKGQYGHVVLEIEPGDKYEFINRIKSGAIPKEYIPAVEQGVLEAMETGPIAGYNLMNIKVKLIDGSYHEVDSSELAFKMAASIALKNAVKKANPILLEPIMKIEIITPEEYVGDVISDFNARRGKITSTDIKDKLHFIYGTVPLTEMFGYATVLRSLTKGRANYIMEVSHYEEAPKEVVSSLIPQAVV